MLIRTERRPTGRTNDDGACAEGHGFVPHFLQSALGREHHPVLSGTPSAVALPSATCKALGCDIPLTDTIETATAQDCFTFSVPNMTGGTRVHISVIEGTPSQTNFQPSWRVLTAQGNPAPNCGSFTTNVDRDCGPLPASGNPYRLEVEDHQRDATGTYRVHFQRLTTGTVCEDTPLTCDTPVTRNIDHPVDSDLFSFSVPNVAGGTWMHIRLVEGPTSALPHGGCSPERVHRRRTSTRCARELWPLCCNTPTGLRAAARER